jgi:hypothetical protein
VHRTPIAQDENPLVPAFPGVAESAAGRHFLCGADSQNLKAQVRVSENCFSANRIFILFNHAILTDAIKRKLAPEKRRPNVRASKGV